MNIYKCILRDNLPRLLSLYNLDCSSSTYGYGDRLFWGWKISDFVNGTQQGGVHALSIALNLSLIDNDDFALRAIDAVIKAIKKIRAKNGSLVEAYPGENSFCVTSLVAFDILSAINILRDHLPDIKMQEYMDIIRPLIQFITINDEKHAIISNHLATAAAAITLWEKLTGEHSSRDDDLLEQIFKHQSAEGWFKEYEGADPGYQTLCTYYLFCIWTITRNEELLRRLEKSASFLKYCVHPDGTIGGLYGSRNTEVYYPGGIVGLAPFSEDFAAIAHWLQRGFKNGQHILPQSIDVGNFIPLLNSYAAAALYWENSQKYIEMAQTTAPYSKSMVKKFDHSGIYVHSTSKYHAIINYKKGGTIKVFDKIDNRIDLEDGGLFGRLTNGEHYSTQHFDPQNRFNNSTIKVNFYMVKEEYPTPLAHIILRMFGLTLFHWIKFGDQFKQFIVRRLITGKKKIDGQCLREFQLHEDKIIVRETINMPRNSIQIKHLGKCKSIHMASSGYYLKQIEQEHQHSDIVEFVVSTDKMTGYINR